MQALTTLLPEHEKFEDPNSRPLTRVGQGVPRRADAAAPNTSNQPPADDEEDEEELKSLVPPGKSEWIDTPTYADQAVRYPTTVRESATRSEIFILPADKERHDAFMDQTRPVEAPQIRLKGGERNFHQASGTYVVVVDYVCVQYRKLISKK